MKTVLSRNSTGFMATLLLLFLFSITSCTRGIDIATIESMPAGAAQDSAWLHYDYGMTMGEQLIVFPHGKITDFGLYHKGSTIAQIEYVEPDIQLAFGDTIVPIAYRSFSYEADQGDGMKTHYKNLIKFDLIKNGKVSASGWSEYEPEYAPMKWTRFIGDYVGWIIVVTFISFVFVLIYLLWFWIYRLVQRKRKRTDVTKHKFWFAFIYLGLSLVFSFLCVYLVHNEEEALNLYYHPNMLAHWSEYATLTKFIPFVILLWVCSIVAMGVEMWKKMKSGWFFINYVGWLFLGFFAIGLTLIVSWFIYVMLPTFLTGLALYIYGKADDMGGGIISKGGSGNDGMIEFRDDHGNKHVSGVDRDSANRKIRGE
ncbi:MAG: hypothetical protein LBM20_04110 [Rikenellaceae bacterium]|jgi:hypothetical protein|nr:hypothetical protein [Rikenellaceae bacterium]